MWRIARGLASRGHQIQVLTSQLEGTEERESVHGVEIIRPFSVAVDGKSQTIIEAIKKIWFMRKIYYHLDRFVQKHPTDIIYNNAYTVTLPAGLIGRKYKIPVITNIGNLQGLGHFKKGANLVVGFIQALKERIIIRYGGHSAIRVASKAVGKKVDQMTNAKVNVIPSPIDDGLSRKVLKSVERKEERRKIAIKNDELFLLYVGALEKVKNLDSLIKVLSKNKRSFKLVIVGEGREEENLRQAAYDRGISDRITFLGRLSNEKVMCLMTAADALLLASKSENLPTVILEALSVNTPVISTDVGGVQEIESKNLTVVNSVKQIGEVIEGGFGRYEDRRVLKKYSVSNITKQFEEMFEDVLRNEPRK